MDENMKEEHLQKELDLEFRKILRIIKPYIPCIMNNGHLYSYRIWLEKLSEAELSEKVERNKYLIELCNQIQDGVLDKPFDKLPLPGPLQSFSSYKESFQNVPLTSSVTKIEIKENALTHESQNNNLRSAPATTLQPPTPPEQNLDNEPKKLISKKPSVFCKPFHEQAIQEEESPQQFVKTHVAPKQIYQKIPRLIPNYCGGSKNTLPHQKVEVLHHQKIDDDGSWYDMSDPSCTTTPKFGSGDLLQSPKKSPGQSELNESHGEEVKEDKIGDLMNVVVKLQQQNYALGQSLEKYETLNKRNVTAETSMLDLKEEVKFLQNRVQGLSEEKASIYTQQSSSKFQDIIKELNKKLQLTQDKNKAHTTDIANLEKKLDEFNRQKQRDMRSLQEQLSATHNETIKILKLHHVSQLKNIENRFVHALANKEEEISHEIVTLKSLYEKKISDIGKDCDEIIQSKNQEIDKLESMVDNQCKRMRDEVQQLKNRIEASNSECNVEKITFLKKCIERMEKLYKKSEKEYSRQISTLKREIKIRDKSLQLQLISQNTERNSNVTSVKQKNVDDLVIQLEERYRKLLDEQQSLFLAEKERDARTIAQLKASNTHICSKTISKIG